VLDKAKEKMDKIHEARETVEISDYTEEDYKKDTAIVYVQTGWDFVKLYGPSITLGVASMACILTSHGIMRRRNFALVAAYKAIEEGFAKYRKRVVEEYGERTDYMFKNGIRDKIVTETVTDENGDSKEVHKVVQTIDPVTGKSVYAKFFDELSAHWCKTPEYNMMFLKTQQNFANDLLHSRGHVFLNEVYDMLDIPRTQAGAVVGWVRGQGDDFIDFGIFDGNDDATRRFVNGCERSILLDFNVDGVIYDMI
jgi:hypothetical protein